MVKIKSNSLVLHKLIHPQEKQFLIFFIKEMYFEKNIKPIQIYFDYSFSN